MSDVKQNRKETSVGELEEQEKESFMCKQVLSEMKAIKLPE